MPLRNRRLEMGNKPIKGIANAVDSKDAVNKGQVDAAVAALQSELDNITSPSLTQIDFISGLIPVPTNADYKIVTNAPYAMTITETTTISTSGTATGTFKINATVLGGTANSVSSTEQSRAHSSANAVVAGDDIVLTVSANATCLNLSFLIKFTRTLAT